jgi:hypothetical protein
MQPAARNVSHYWTIEAVSLESTPMRLPTRAPAFAMPCSLLAGMMGLLATSPASATEGFFGIRSLGMGETLRGAATSGTGPLLNPSGMSLTQQYNVEADYQYARPGGNNFLHASIVDSTSGYKVAGGLYYTYHSDAPVDQTSGHTHEVGLALSVPFGEHVAVGATGKYFWLSGDLVDEDRSDYTYDVGITLRPANVFSLGVVGYNLRDLHAIRVARQAVGYGAVLTPTDFLLIAVDGVTNLNGMPEGTGVGRATRVSAGAELFLAKKAALRLGGGYDGPTENGFFTVGLSAVSEVGALDFGLRQDVVQRGSEARSTVVGASVRLFIPQP